MRNLGHNQETHVLMVTLPYQGHINPMLKFARRLIPKGVHVTFVTTALARDRLLSAVVKNPNDDTEKPKVSSLDLEFIPDGTSPDNPKAVKVDLDFLRSFGHKHLSDLITKLGSKKRLSCIIANLFTPWVPEVAVEHNIPCAMLWIQACAVFSIYYRFFTKSDPFPDLNDTTQTVKIPALPLLEAQDLPSFILPTVYPQLRTLLSEFVESLDKVKWVLANSFYELESEVIESMDLLKPVIPIGPLVSPFLLGEEEENNLDGETLDMWESDGSCMEWLDVQKPSSVIYISFGSLVESKETLITEIATALKNLESPFLWVIRPLETAATVGILQEMLANGVGKVVGWALQERILSHVAVSCFVTHCGWNSTLETVVSGKPVVAYPSWSDQPTDARLMVDVFGIGVRMKNGDGGMLLAEEVERCLKVVADEGTAAAGMKRRVAELSKAARKAVARGGSSSLNIERFVREIAGK